MSATAPLALPGTAPRATRPKTLVLGALLLGSSVTMAVGAEIALYLQARGDTRQWPPTTVQYDNFISVMISLTMIMSLITASWAVSANHRGNHRQTLAALLMTCGFGLVVLNAFTFLIKELGFGPDDHRFGTIFYLLVFTAAGNIVAALVPMFGITVRALGRQVSAEHGERITAVTAYWYFATGLWLLVYMLLYWLK